MVPKDEPDNDRVTDLALEYYDKCEAKAKSGKTVWIGKNIDTEEII